MRSIFLYILTDPRTGVIQYVGCSADPFTRFEHHCSEDGSSKKHQWIKRLKALGLCPLMNLLDEVPENLAAQIEADYIRVFKAIGIPLLNSRSRTPRRQLHVDKLVRWTSTSLLTAIKSGVY